MVSQEAIKKLKDNKNKNGQSANSQAILNKANNEFDSNNQKTWGKVGRNEKCPCGSGKKYKNCHGRLI